MGEVFCGDPCTIRRCRCQTLVHQYQSWGRVRADLIKRTGLERQETDLACSAHVFILNLRGAAFRGEDFIDGRRISFSPRRAGSLICLPAGTRWSGWDEGDATASYLLVSVERQFAEETFGETVRHCLADLPPAIGFRDSIVELALQRIAIELRQPDPLGLAMVESQAIQLLGRMVRANGAAHELAKGGLSPFDLKQVLEVLETLDKAWALPDLAREIGLSRFHLWRAFKQSTGITPYAFRAKRRLEKSCDLLRSSGRSLTEIAMECGFGSSSHFTTAFKRAFGTTPTDFRRQCRL